MTPGFNIGSKTLLAEQGKLPIKFTCPASTSTCPATLLNKGELHCEDSKHYLPSGASLGLVLLASIRHFLPNSLSSCKGASGYVAHWTEILKQGSHWKTSRMLSLA